MGDQVLYFEDVNEGDEAPQRTRILNRTDLVMYAGASGDFNPLHTDEAFVTEVAGFPTVFAHGMLTMALTGAMVTDTVGDGRLVRFGGRFRSQVWPGDTLTGRAEVVAVAVTPVGAFGVVAGMAAADGAEAVPVPTPLVAVTENV